MTPKEILIAARQKITPPQCWTQGAASRDATGKQAMIGDVAVSWCLIGAVREVSYSGELDSADDAIAMMREAAQGSVADFNDTHTHQEVLALFDKAIAEAP